MGHLTGYGFFAKQDEALAEEYDTKRWACYSCSKPTSIVRVPSPRGYDETFRCPVNRFAPHAASHNCKSYEMVPGIDELWC